jgi:hypothetical protein
VGASLTLPVHLLVIARVARFGVDLQNFLRGRMGASFYHAMGFLNPVASSADEYVDIAVRLGTDRLYRHQCSTVIKHLSPVIWQREEACVAFPSYQLLSCRDVHTVSSPVQPQLGYRKLQAPRP